MAGWKNDRKNKKTWKQHSLFAVALFQRFFHICKCSKTKLQSRSHCAEKKVNEIVIWLKHSSHHCRREGGGSEKKRKADNFRHGGLKQGSNGQGWELMEKTGIAFVVGSGRFSFDKFPEWTIEWIRRLEATFFVRGGFVSTIFFISANAQKRSFKADLTVRKRK